MHAHIGRLRDPTWTNGREWDAFAKQCPHIYDEIRHLLDTFADAPVQRLPNGPR